MKKIIGFACCYLLGSFLGGCGDSKNNNDNEFVNFVKDALKYKKEHVSIYDFNNNKFYIYDHSNLDSNEINNIFNSPSLKNCSKTTEEINKIVLLDEDITFTCTQSAPNFDDIKVKFQVIGKKHSYNQSFIDSDINYLLDFNKNIKEKKQIGQIPKNEINNTISSLKYACNISQDKEIYNDCGYPNSRIKIIGYK